MNSGSSKNYKSTKADKADKSDKQSGFKAPLDNDDVAANRGRNTSTRGDSKRDSSISQRNGQARGV
ncbi:MAG: hypothetical protein JST16_16825 [Bdellovibrionales bacterium]|nr:hypothetical protein [Bdellovibrionales bacterium]